MCLKMMEMMSSFDRKFRRLPEERREREGYCFTWIGGEMKRLGVKGLVGGLFGKYADLDAYPRDGHQMESERASEYMTDEFGESAGVYEDSTRIFQKGYFSLSLSCFDVYFISEKRRQYLEELCGYVEVHTWLLEKKVLSLSDLSLDGATGDTSSPPPALRHVITFISKYVQIANKPGVFDDLRLVHLTLSALSASYSFCVLLLDLLPSLSPLRPLLNSHFFHVVCFSILDPGDLFGDLYTSADISAIATLSNGKDSAAAAPQFETDISHLTLRLMAKMHIRLRKSDDKGGDWSRGGRGRRWEGER